MEVYYADRYNLVGYHKQKHEKRTTTKCSSITFPSNQCLFHSVICRTSSAIQFATCAVAFTLLAAMNWKAVHNPPIFSSSKASLCVRPATTPLPLSSTVANVDIELLHPDLFGSWRTIWKTFDAALRTWEFEEPAKASFTRSCKLS
jgi:hypothetical protein